jgi:hypothetical protein
VWQLASGSCASLAGQATVHVADSGGKMLSVGMATNHAKISIFFPSVWLLGIAVCCCTGLVQ